MELVPEASYPVTFREREATRLGELISHHSSAVLVGMKRVGINNFLRFFLHHPTTRREYVAAGGTVIYITVDLNDLVERELYPFWILVLKRLSDTIEDGGISDELTRFTKHVFTESIQLKDLFVALDGVQKVLNRLTREGYSPVLVLNRFDRMQPAITTEFYHNLQGLKDATGQKLTYIFTSWRPLPELVSGVFTRASLSVFSTDVYLLPTDREDSAAICHSFAKRYRMSLPPDLTDELIRLSGGHVQYLQLSLLRIKGETHPPAPAALAELLLSDDQISLQSEELFENLTDAEKQVLTKAALSQSLSAADRAAAPYLWDTGLITAAGMVFSPLLSTAVRHKSTNANDAKTAQHTEFTKKELALMTILRANPNMVVERDDIVAAVWPEVVDLSVSDWAIDRLVSRVRTKLRLQGDREEIVTVVTRGYKVVIK